MTETASGSDPTRKLVEQADAFGREQFRVGGQRTAANLAMDLASEIRRLSECLRYLTSCSAATLESLPKRASKHDRNRHRDITAEALRFMRGGWPTRAGDDEWVRTRALRAIAESETQSAA